jgi:hypothetical protein
MYPSYGVLKEQNVLEFPSSGGTVGRHVLIGVISRVDLSALFIGPGWIIASDPLFQEQKHMQFLKSSALSEFWMADKVQKLSNP